MFIAARELEAMGDNKEFMKVWTFSPGPLDVQLIAGHPVQVVRAICKTFV